MSRVRRVLSQAGQTVGYTLQQGISLIKAVGALLREHHTLNKAASALFTTKAASLNKAVIMLWHTDLLRDPYCMYENTHTCL